MKLIKYSSIFLILTLAISTIISGCSSQQSLKNSNEKIIAAVTILPQKALVKEVCGDLVDIVTIVPPGNSPSNYEPTPKEMQDFSKATVYFTIGVPTEKANILPRVENIEVVDLPSKVEEFYPEIEIGTGDCDPHIWLSPKRTKIMVEEIANTMIRIDDKNAQVYQQNAEIFLQELDRTDAEIKKDFEGIKTPVFIAFHPAYGYFADDYGLQMYALEQDGKEATPQHLQDMVDLAKKENIKVIFSQAEIDSKQPDAFAEEIGGKKIMLEPLSEDYIENLKRISKAVSGALK